MAWLNCSNLFGVERYGELIRATRPLKYVMTPSAALNLAAHLVAVADPTGVRFGPLLAAICGPAPDEPTVDVTDPRQPRAPSCSP